MTIRLGILGSTRGTVLQAIIDAIENKSLDAHIEIVVSNKSDAYILERGKRHHLKTLFVDPKDLSREKFDERISRVFREHQVDVILLIGYMRILSPEFVKTWRHKVINVHPSLLPKYAGLMDRAVYQAVLNAGDHETGCTIHFVEEDVDAGEIVLQKKCRVESGDTVETLRNKVQALEKTAFIEVIQHWGKNT